MLQALIYRIKKNPYKFFIVKLVVLFSIIFILDFSIGSVLRYFYFKQESGLQYRTTHAIEETTDDLIIFGSSRADHHYNPSYFEKQLNMSTYNVGRDNMLITYHYAVLRGILKRYTPKVIILDIFKGEFKLDENSYDKLSSLLPYYKSHPEMREIIELKSRFEKIKLLSSVYPYNSSLFTIAVGNTEWNKKKWSDNQGYVALKQQWDGPIRIDSIANDHDLDTTFVNYYESFLRDCKDAGILLFVICSPYYIQTNHTDKTIETAKELAKKYKVRFLDYSDDSIFIKNGSYFADIEHLNDKGAKVFSNLIIDTIDNTIEDKIFNTELSFNRSSIKQVF